MEEKHPNIYSFCREVDDRAFQVFNRLFSTMNSNQFSSIVSASHKSVKLESIIPLGTTESFRDIVTDMCNGQRYQEFMPQLHDLVEKGIKSFVQTLFSELFSSSSNEMISILLDIMSRTNAFIKWTEYVFYTLNIRFSERIREVPVSTMANLAYRECIYGQQQVVTDNLVSSAFISIDLNKENMELENILDIFENMACKYIDFRYELFDCEFISRRRKCIEKMSTFDSLNFSDMKQSFLDTMKKEERAKRFLKEENIEAFLWNVKSASQGRCILNMVKSLKYKDLLESLKGEDIFRELLRDSMDDSPLLSKGYFLYLQDCMKTVLHGRDNILILKNSNIRTKSSNVSLDSVREISEFWDAMIISRNVCPGRTVSTEFMEDEMKVVQSFLNTVVPEAEPVSYMSYLVEIVIIATYSSHISYMSVEEIKKVINFSAFMFSEYMSRIELNQLIERLDSIIRQSESNDANAIDFSEHLVCKLEEFNALVDCKIIKNIKVLITKTKGDIQLTNFVLEKGAKRIKENLPHELLFNPRVIKADSRQETDRITRSTIPTVFDGVDEAWKKCAIDELKRGRRDGKLDPDVISVEITATMFGDGSKPLVIRANTRQVTILMMLDQWGPMTFGTLMGKFRQSAVEKYSASKDKEGSQDIDMTDVLEYEVKNVILSMMTDVAPLLRVDSPEQGNGGYHFEKNDIIRINKTLNLEDGMKITLASVMNIADEEVVKDKRRSPDRTQKIMAMIFDTLKKNGEQNEIECEDMIQKLTEVPSFDFDFDEEGQKFDMAVNGMLEFNDIDRNKWEEHQTLMLIS